MDKNVTLEPGATESAKLLFGAAKGLIEQHQDDQSKDGYSVVDIFVLALEAKGQAKTFYNEEYAQWELREI